MQSIHAVRTAPPAPAAAPGPAPGRDHIGAAMSLLGDARIVLSGTIVEGDYRRLLDLRVDLLRAARLLRTVARTSDMFAAEYRAGAADAIRAARTIGRAHVDLTRFANASGGYYGFGWPVVQRRVQEQLEGAKLRVDSAHDAAYTGTHY